MPIAHLLDRRFWIFAWDYAGPRGGLNDFVDAFSDQSTAIAIASARRDSNVEIIDSHRGPAGTCIWWRDKDAVHMLNSARLAPIKTP